jgi:Asp/Glu/hydantoin racemase
VPRILAINPNTTSAVTALVESHLRATAPAIDWRMATGRFGARYITSEASSAVASHAAIDAWAEHGADCDAVLLACFGDPGLFALRELSPVPVVGLAEASMQAAAETARRFSIVTGGPRWAPMLERLAQALGFGVSLASVRTIEITGAQAAADPDRTVAALAKACKDAQAKDSADAVILGGAGFAGFAALVEPAIPGLGIRVIDSVIAGAQAAGRLALGAPWPYARRAGAKPIETTGIGAALADKLVE